MNCDILVIGAGPAGSMAAKTASENGVDVVLIERSEKIGEPVRCAEGINKFLFEDTGIEKNDSFIDQEITGTKIYFYDEVYELNSEEWQGYTLDRKLFDKYLAGLAEHAGAKLYTATRATGMTRKNNHWRVCVKSVEEPGDIEAKIVIGAGGFHCKVGVWAGMRKKWRESEYACCYELLLECPNLREADKFHFAFGREFPGGYAWIFPKGSTANVGVGIAAGVSAKDALDYYIEEYPGTREILGDGLSVLERRGGCIPSTGPRPVYEIVSDGILLVGDAAGIVDPIMSEGIPSSMLSGIAAGEVASKAIKRSQWGKDVLVEYDTAWRGKKCFGGVPLGMDMDMRVETKDLFYTVFTDKRLPKDARGLLISLFSLTDEEDIAKTIEEIKGMVRQ